MKKVIQQSTNEVNVPHTSDSKLYALVSRADEVYVLARDVRQDRYEWRPLGPGFTGGAHYAYLPMQDVCQTHPNIAIHNALKKFYDVFEFDSWSELITWTIDKPKSRWRIWSATPIQPEVWAIIDGNEMKIVWSQNRTDPGAHFGHVHSYGAGWADTENNYPVPDDVIEAWRPI